MANTVLPRTARQSLVCTASVVQLAEQIDRLKSHNHGASLLVELHQHAVAADGLEVLLCFHATPLDNPQASMACMSRAAGAVTMLFRGGVDRLFVVITAWHESQIL